MTTEPPQLKLVAARNIAGSGAVMGIAGGLLLWLMGWVGPVYFPYFVVAGAVIGGILFGVPGYLFERKVVRERKSAQAEASAKAAADYAAALAHAREQGAAAAAASASAAASAPGYPSSYGGTMGPTGAPAWTPMSSAGATAAPIGPGTAGGSPGVSATGADTPVTWPLDEPLCVLETNRERDAWEATKALHLSPDRIIGFTTFPPEDLAHDLGIPAASIFKISRVEGEGNVDPGDLERIGNFIERHLGGGEGRVVVLPAVENLVEAGNVRNVRRLLEVVRDLAQGSRGSMLVTLDPVSLPEAQVTLLERGARKLGPSGN